MPDGALDARPDWRLDLLFVAVLGALLAGALATGFELGPIKKGPAAVLTAVYIQVWGLLFLLSYFFPNRSYLLKGLMWLCENTSRPRGRWTALLWGVFAIALGAIPLLQGLGVLAI